MCFKYYKYKNRISLLELYKYTTGVNLHLAPILSLFWIQPIQEVTPEGLPWSVFRVVFASFSSSVQAVTPVQLKFQVLLPQQFH